MTGKNPASTTIATLEPSVSPSASDRTVTRATYGTFRSVIAAGMTSWRATGSATSRAARPIPTTLARTYPTAAAFSVSIR